MTVVATPSVGPDDPNREDGRFPRLFVTPEDNRSRGDDSSGLATLQHLPFSRPTSPQQFDQIVQHTYPARIDATIEIPVVQQRYYERPQYYYEPSHPRVRHDLAPKMRRIPAPLWLRIVVSALGVLCAISLMGLAVELRDPSLFRSLHTQPPVTLVQPATDISSTPSNIAMITSTPQLVTYRVPTNSYSIGIVVDKPVWIEVSDPPNAPKPTVSALVTPTSGPRMIHLVGSAKVMVAAQTSAITFTDGSRHLGTISAPRAGVPYLLEAPKT